MLNILHIMDLLFYILLIIVIANIILILPEGVQICLVSLIAISILYMFVRKPIKVKEEHDELNLKIQSLEMELGGNLYKCNSLQNDSAIINDKHPNDKSDKPIDLKNTEVSNDVFNNTLSKDTYYESASSGDTQLANRMKYMALQPRMSQDIRARWNTEKFRHYVEEELNEQENRDWWDVDAAYLDDEM